MINSYLKIALRNIQKHKTNSTVSLVGLSLGFLSVLFIGLYLSNELNYDRFHHDAELTYRLVDPWGSENNITTPAFVPNPWAEALAQEFPEIESYVRIQRRLRFSPLVSYQEARFFEDGFISADSTFFKIFNFKLIAGDPLTALSEPGSIVMTESKAKKFFGSEDPIDKIITLDNERTLRVTGVLEDLPTQTHLSFNYILPIEQLPPFNWVYSYFKLSKGTDIHLLEKKIQPFLKERFAEKYTSHQYTPSFQPITDIHLKSNLTYELKNNGNVSYLYLLATVGMLILIIGSFNYINMRTAQASLRVKEFGMRKALGGIRSQLIIQSVSESIILSTVAFGVALALMPLLISPFENLVQRHLNWSDYLSEYFLIGLSCSAMIGVLSGLYPALLLSGAKPTEALRGKISSGMGNAVFRKVLVAGQYTISAILITSTVVIFLQLKMLNSKELGFDRSQVIIVNGRVAEGLMSYASPIKDAFEVVPEVEKVAFSQTVPGDYASMASISYECEGVEENKGGIKTFFVSPDFAEALGITIVTGRDFSEDHVSDTATYVINEAFAKTMGWKDPIGQRIKMTILDKMQGPVIGVAKDFHFASLHSAIEPVVMVILPESFQKILIRIKPGTDITATLAKLRQQWMAVLPDYPFEFQFMDEKFAGLYEADRQFSNIFKVFTLIAIFLTCFGLFGVISFEINKRMKEIGIRNIVGATVFDIFMVINKPIVLIIVVSIVVSTPVSIYLLKGWLENFATTIELQWWHHVTPLIVLFVISIVTTMGKIFRAATQNPANVLRNN